MERSPTQGLPDPVRLLGLEVHPVRRSELLTALATWAGDLNGPTRRMFYTNAHVFNLAYRDPSFRAVLNSADVLICEGIGGLVGGRIAGIRFPEQLATMDWMDDLLTRLNREGRSLYLLGDEPGVARRCGQLMQTRHPGLRVVGTHHGYFHGRPHDTRAITDEINAARPAVLLVGMGNPLQEFWVEEHRGELEANLVLSLGAMFRWYAGVERRAPRWMRRLGLEWLLRLINHPIRHFRRYVIGNPSFLWRCVLQRIGRADPGGTRQ